jgi:hypothetical protein
MSEPSVYDSNAPRLLERGFFPLPIGPNSKKPQHFVPSLNEFHDTQGWTHPARRPETSPQPGAGIGVRLGKQADGTYIVALDWDNEDAAIAAMDAFPPTVTKEGQRGFTAFYRSAVPIPSRDFRVGGVVVVQVLSDGRQTVVPPTMHPDTKRPYIWTSTYTLYNVPLGELVELPEDYIERIETTLKPLGYEPEPEKPAKSNGHAEDDEESPFQELNNLALRNLAAWVPDLNLYKCKRCRGRTASYEAVATWRPSTTGKPLEERKLHLSISGKGITDYGTHEGFSPINLVMRARSCSRSDAIGWLQERVYPKGPEVDFEALAGSTAAEEDDADADADHGAAERRRPKPPPGLGEAWHFGDPAPAQMPMLVLGLLPRKGFGYLGGQWGTFKTFMTDDLAVAIGTCGTFGGQQVAMQGVVVQIELEGSHSELRLHAAAAARNAEGELPIVHLRVEPPSIMISGRANPAWPKWSASLAKYAQEVAAYYGLPLVLITIDPQNRIAGFKDEQSSAEGQVVSNAMIKLSQQADCLVLVVDHLGKDPDAGLRGTSAKETNPLFILSTGETQTDVYCKRHLTVRKMRNGISGVAVSFWMEDREATLNQFMESEDGTKQVVAYTGKTLSVRWGDKLRPVDMPEGAGTNEGSKQQRRALAILGDMIAGKSGCPLPPECDAPDGLRGVKLESWRLRLIDKTVIEGKNTSAAFSQLKNALLDRKEIDISHGFVWVPLP